MPGIVTLTLNPTVDKNCDVQQVVPDKKLRCGEAVYHPGGGGLNVARVIHELGGEATAYWTCGGAIGELLCQLLDEENICHRSIDIRAMTRENLIVHERCSGHQFRLGMPGATLTKDEVKNCLDCLKAIDPAPEYLVLSGSLPPGVDENLYAQVAASISSSSRVVLYTSGSALHMGLETPVYLIKPNMRELGDLAGRAVEDESDICDVARSLIDQGKVKVIVTSLGSGGTFVTTSDEHQHIRAPTVKIRSKVGAGDSTVAGIVLALSHGKPIIEAVRYGVAAGAAAVTTEGTELCRRGDVERLFGQMMASQK